MVEAYLKEKLNNIGVVLKADNGKDRIVIKIEGDCNDADYNTEVTEIFLKNEKAVDNAVELIDNIIKHQDELMTSHAIEEGIEEDWFDTLSREIDIPGDSYGYCHTITDITIDYINASGTQYRIL